MTPYNLHILRLLLNDNAMFYKTFICFYVSEVKPLSFSLCSQMFDVEYTTFKTFVTQMSDYLYYFFSINVL